uniref:Integral membrane protein n=1 Tax=Streptomyces sp. NBC_00049 TaxID=2903617 RepID=A0AAU2JMD9_9ACTN
MNTPLPPVEELALIDRELAQIDGRRTYLLGRRQWLLTQLQLPRPSGPAAAPAVWAPPGPAQETSAPSAQNVLLTLGAVLLAVAALAFTLVSWGSMGITGRSAVLAAVTATALAAPVPLLRRGLRSTAESVAAVALLLTVLDAYALFAVGMPDTDPTAYAAGAAAVLAAGWAGYGAALRTLRIPLPAAVLAAQFPLPLAALAAQAGPSELGWALLATAALDAALALRVRAAAVAAAALGAGALLIGVSGSWAATSVAGALSPAALLLAAAALGVAAAWREPRAWAAALAGGLAAVVALGGVARQGADPAWSVVVHLLVALPLLAAVRVPALPEPVRRGLVRAGAVVAALAALAGWSAVAPALLARVRVLDEVWAATTPARDPYWPGAAVPVLLLLTAGAAWWLARALSRPEPVPVAVVLAWAGLFTAPELLGFPVAAVFAVQLAVTAAAGLLALRSSARGTAIAAAVVALGGAVNVSLGALDGRAATFAVWGLLGAGSAAAAAYGPAARPLRSGAAACAVGYAAGVLVAVAAVTDLPVAWWSLPVLAVPAAVAGLGPRLGGVRLSAEIAAGVTGVLAVALSAVRPGTFALVLALAGVICAGAAVRPERRVLGWPAGALFVAATWVRLAESGVATPEAYTLPVTLPALAVGFLRRRRDPGASSWTAYGPGLTATLLPSLLTVLVGSQTGTASWLRPLLLGVAALAVTLAGARWRLQAPLLVGGAVLAAVALHELAPYVVQVAGVLPRWVLPALAGLLLLAVGATYEKRLRDARRLRDAITRLG